MSEKYFEYILLILLLAALLLPVMVWHMHTRLKFLQNLVRINILKYQQKNNQNLFFSTVILNECTRLLFFNHNKESRVALNQLVGGHTDKAADFLQNKHPQTVLLLRAHTDTISAYGINKKQKIIKLTDNKFAVFLPILAYLCNDRQTMLSAVSRLNAQIKSYSNTIRAYYNAISAYAYLHEGDMLSASQQASAALKFFQKRKFAVETASCHLILAQIYRISCINDVAQTMIESAIKIYQTQKTPLFQARATAAKGMLMVFENRYDEAHDIYNKVISMPITEQLRADIYNQQTLLYLAQKNTKKAQHCADMALTMQKQLKNQHGTAFALQLTAHIAFLQNKNRKTATTAMQALHLYRKQKNYSAAAECMYLAAEAEFKMHHLTAAEAKLREILRDCKTQPNSFHIANAYSLLGLIYLQKQDLQRAKVLFQQSLHLEQSHQRCEGLVADYMNLALIDELTDYASEAASNRKIAMEYAQQSGEEELIALIEKNNKDR